MKKRFVLFILLAVLGLTVCACDTVSEEPMETVTDSLAETTDTSAVTESETVASTDISDTEWTTEALTEPDTEGITEADTSSDTQEPVSIDADLLLSTVLSRESENALADLRLTSEIQISMVSGGNLGAMKTTLMGSTSFIRDGEALALEMNLPSMIPYRLICVDGYLYVSGADGNFRCPLEAADESMIWGDLTAGMHPSTEDLPSDTDVAFLLEKLRAYIDTETPSMLFANVAWETDPDTGSTTLTATGLSESAKTLLDDLCQALQQMPSEGVFGADMNQLQEILASFKENTFSLVLKVDDTLTLSSVTVTLDMRLPAVSSLVGHMPSTVTVTLSSLFDRSEQTVTAPVDAESYTETDWRTLFDSNPTGPSTDETSAEA